MLDTDVPSGNAALPRDDVPAPESPKRKRPLDDQEGSEKKKVKKLSEVPPKRKRAAEEEDTDKASKKSKPTPAEKPKGKKKSTAAATGANTTPLKNGGTKAKKADKDTEKIDKQKVQNAPKLDTSAANSNWRNQNPEEKLGDVKIPERDRALRDLNRIKKAIEKQFRELYKRCYDPYEKAFLDVAKREDRRDPEIVRHLDLIEGLFGRRDNEREDLRRRVLAFKDPQAWDEAKLALRARRWKKAAEEEGEKKQKKEEGAPVDERVQGLVEVLRSIPALEDHVGKCEARVAKDAKRVRADIALEKKGQRNVETRVYEVPVDRFAAKTLKSVKKSIQEQDVKDAKEMLARAEAPDEGPGEEEEEKGEKGSEKTSADGQESDGSAEYIQL
ncbi:uncharacterized protein PG986_004247 [Apiospora aurea]|uniref:Uncharacterized protein n=1 Tax=Apiospora aurea TaxID=335848 RepID=A0ABR1QM96_9PEZI